MQFTLKNVMYTDGGGMQRFCWNASSKTHEWCEACIGVSCDSINGRKGANQIDRLCAKQLESDNDAMGSKF